MIEAAGLAASGCAHGTVVGADEQTAGVGRYGRHWHSEPEAGIYISVVLRLPFGMETLPLITLALGLADSRIDPENDRHSVRSALAQRHPDRRKKMLRHSYAV